MNFRELKELCNGDRAAQHRFNDLRETVYGRDPSPEEVNFVLGNTQLTGGEGAVEKLNSALQTLKTSFLAYKSQMDELKTASQRSSASTTRLNQLLQKEQTKVQDNEVKIRKLTEAINNATTLVEQIAGAIPRTTS